MTKNKSYQEKSGRNDRRNKNDKQSNNREIIEISDDDMKAQVESALKKFIDFQDKEQESDHEEKDEEQEQPVKKEYDYSVFSRLRNNNGKDGGLILHSLFFAMCDKEEEKAKHLGTLMDYFIANKVFKP